MSFVADSWYLVVGLTKARRAGLFPVTSMAKNIEEFWKGLPANTPLNVAQVLLLPATDKTINGVFTPMVCKSFIVLIQVLL